jgi:hypothetical protein
VDRAGLDLQIDALVRMDRAEAPVNHPAQLFQLIIQAMSILPGLNGWQYFQTWLPKYDTKKVPGPATR